MKNTRLAVAICVALLAWLNLYLCRELFVTEYTGHMNSMHGYWMALARLLDAPYSWLQPTWWPYWDVGQPLEFSYSPLIPVLTGMLAKFTGSSVPLAFNRISGLVYVLTPLTLFYAVWQLSRSLPGAFAAAALYSLSSATELIVPDAAFSLSNFGNARRMYVAFEWDEVPHLAALTLLPLVLVFLMRSFETRRVGLYLLSIATMALMILASAFGATLLVISTGCLLLAYPKKRWVSNAIIVAVTGIAAYLLVCPWLPPELIQAIRLAGKLNDGRLWTVESLQVLVVLAVGLALLAWCLRAARVAWQFRLASFLVFTSSVIIAADAYFDRALVPQPVRYKLESEMAICVLLVFLAMSLLRRLPRPASVVLLILLVPVFTKQVISHRRYAKALLPSVDISKTLEYQLSTWIERNLPDGRVSLTGSIAQWHNAFVSTPQFAGASWSTAYNLTQQHANYNIRAGGAVMEKTQRVGLTWLKAFGAIAVVVPGPNSPEYWKAFHYPDKFSGLLPILWQQQDTTLYQVPRRSQSLAHVIDSGSVVRHVPEGGLDITETETYVNAIEDSRAPSASFAWKGFNDAFVQANIPYGNSAVSVQISYHPGWKAYDSTGVQIPVTRDGLGLLFFRPTRLGSQSFHLRYEGTTSQHWQRGISLTTFCILMAGVFLVPLSRRFQYYRTKENQFT